MSFSELTKRENLLKARLLWLSFELVFNQYSVNTPSKTNASDAKQCPPGVSFGLAARRVESRTSRAIIVICAIIAIANY